MEEYIRKYGEKEGWKQMHKEGLTPWAKQEAALGLQDIIQSISLPIGKYGVPGCGEGLDVEFLASKSPKSTVFGFDLSPIPLEIATKRPDKQKNAAYICLDFFKDHKELQVNSFDLIFDYTFLCALQPTMRTKWAERMNELLRQGGVLITLMFPLVDIKPEDPMEGPPFPLSIEIYNDLLLGNFSLSRIESVRSHPGREGREKIAVWTRK